MKKPVSIKIDEKLWVFIKNKPNKSRYIEELIKQDIQQAQVKPIVQSVIHELMSNETFFREISERLKVPVRVTAELAPPAEVFVPKPPDPITGYPCCQSATKRCKHWEFDGVGDGWVNILTGEIKEA